jgi:pimeloyl-ACP methyl ester carboxylesterase
MLLHGWPDDGELWRHQVPALVAAGYRVIVPDLRGFGASGKPADVAAYTAPCLVGDVVAVLDALAVPRAHLVGHDWGAAIGWLVAALAGERVASLTALSVGHPAAFRTAGWLQREKSWYMLLFQFPGVAETWLSQHDFRNLREFVFDQAPEAFPPEDRERYVAALRRDGALTAALNWYRANMPPAGWLREPPDPPPVTVPTLIIWGEADTNLGITLLERSAATVTGPLRVERLPGVSHWVQQQAPEAVNRLLVEFLTSQRS